ncbi:MAG TPA: hypothetical protein VMU45_05980 [Candidatus Eisenbacteria bacterium]|nr:hypothetical protein [Candidatus Eisenbacteria bacterium]
MVDQDETVDLNQQMLEDEVRDPRFREFFVDPWSDETRSTRRNLLILGIVGITMAAAKIYPTSIDALGLHTQGINPSALLIVLAVVVAYLTLTYVLYVYTDLMGKYGARSISVSSPQIIEPNSQPADRADYSEVSDTRDDSSMETTATEPDSEVSDAVAGTQLIEVDDQIQELRNFKRKLASVQVVRLCADALIPLLTGVVSVTALLWRAWRL